MVGVNGKVFGESTFSNGETIFLKPDICRTVNSFKLVYESDADLFKLYTAVKYVEDTYPNSAKILAMMYIPYSRMDRAIDSQVFSLKYLADFINQLNFQDVRVLDPHSSVSVEKLYNVATLNLESCISHYIYNHFTPDFLMFPDAGASKKYVECLPNLTKNFPYLVGKKERNTANRGELKADSYTIITDGADSSKFEGGKVLIIDDICVYGGTVKLAKAALAKLGFTDIRFWVTHCEQAAFEGDIFSQLTEVCTTSSLIRQGKADNLVIADHSYLL